MCIDEPRTPIRKHIAMNTDEHSEHKHHHHSAHHDTDAHKGKHQGHEGESGHDAHAGHSVAGFWKRFVISTIITIPVLALSHMIQQFFGFEFSFPGDRYLLAILSTFIFFYGGWPFLKGLYDEVKRKAIGMMTLIGVAITAAWAYSFAVTLGLEGMDFYWEMATLIDIMLIGHWIEMKSIMGASKALELLVNMMPSTAHMEENGETRDVPIDELKRGDVVRIKPGEKIPVDGEILDGESYLDESMLTGESKLVKKAKGDKVIGGSINGNGTLKVEVQGTGKDTYLNKVIKMVEDAQKLKSKTQHLADRAAKVLTFVALGGGVITLVIWLMLGFEFVYALERMVTVMVISCPHALGLAVPLVVAISTTVSAKHGLLIRNRTAFENARKITTIIFDKTGILTKGSHEVSRIVSLSDSYDEKELLRLASGIEQNSEHHIAKGIMEKVRKEDVRIPESDKFNYLPGQGLEGVVEGKEIKVVGPNYIKDKNISLPEHDMDEAVETVVYVMIDNEVVGFISMADQIRDESQEAIDVLKQNGMSTLLLTGDNERVAAHVANKLGMDSYFANVLPHHKLEKIKELQAKGKFVAMTGDGVNDAPALAQADVGIAVGSGTDVAAETADIILVNSNPKDIAHLILFGRATYRKMMQNLAWATGYNVVAIPLAAGALYSFDIILSPAAGAVLMSLSTIIVAINAQFLRRAMGKVG